MKDKELRYGIHKAGKFIFNISKLLLDNSSANEVSFFEVLVSENKLMYTCYIDLVQDERFGLFSNFIKYDRVVRADEIVEYNAYIHRRYSNPHSNPNKRELCSMPLWRLSRSTLVDIINIAAEIK